MGRPRLTVPESVLDEIRRLAATGIPRFEIAPKVGLTYLQVYKLCVRNGIAGQQPGHDRFVPTSAEEARLRHLIEVDKVSHRKAAAMMGWSYKRVFRLIPRLGLKTQRRGPRPGPGHPEWKGGRLIDKNGYVMIYSPGHPNARGRYALEHRLVMSDHLGRPLTDKEVVHHRNGDKQDNRLKNLELFDQNSTHLRHELTGRCPRWTEDGKRRIREGVRRAREKIRLAKERDDSAKPRKTRQKKGDSSVAPRHPS